MASIIITTSLLIAVSLVLGIIHFFTKSDEKTHLTLKEFILELGIFITLIPSVLSFVYIVFLIIDNKFQDALSVNNYYNPNSDLASFISSLVVTFPLCLLLIWLKRKNLNNNPERKSIKAFGYGVFITLFATSLSLIVSLITVIYNFLMGELSIAFFLKVLTVIMVAGLLFDYSYVTYKQNDKIVKKYFYKLPKIYFIISSILVICAIVYSIMIFGTPSEMRKRKFDNLRLQNISEIQNRILSYWQRDYKLPDNLINLKSDIDYSHLVLKDPKTKLDYEYKIITQSEMKKVIGEQCRKFYPNRYTNVINEKINCEIPTDATFQICATFESVRAYDDNGVAMDNYDNSFGVAKESTAFYPDAIGGRLDIGYYYEGDKNPKWNHPVGNYCFTRKIEVNKQSVY